MLPSKDQALEFCLMLNAGLPSEEAIRFFLDGDTSWDEDAIRGLHDRWVRSRTVQEAMLQVMGKPWQKLSLQERMTFAINKHYNEMAYFLYSHNYSTISGADKTKADTCRVALEQKLAGTAGRLGPLEEFWKALQDKSISLKERPQTLPALAPFAPPN